MDPVNTPHLSWAGVAELVDATDSKSVDGDIVSVRFRPPVPQLLFIFFKSILVLMRD
jgi:hypothetical protein